MDERGKSNKNLSVALEKMRIALAILDEEDVSAEIGAYLDLAACRLEILVEQRDAA